MEKLGFASLTPIEKGWSGDKKYKAVDQKGHPFLLRISPIARQTQREKLYDTVCRLPEDLSMSRPLAQGMCSEGFYTLWSWVDGRDAEAVIPTLPETEQYRLGREAGEILRQIHVLPAPLDLEPWDVRFSHKIDRKLQQYAACSLSYPDGAKIVE